MNIKNSVLLLNCEREYQNIKKMLNPKIKKLQLLFILNATLNIASVAVYQARSAAHITLVAQGRCATDNDQFPLYDSATDTTSTGSGCILKSNQVKDCLKYKTNGFSEMMQHEMHSATQRLIRVILAINVIQSPQYLVSSRGGTLSPLLQLLLFRVGKSRPNYFVILIIFFFQRNEFQLNKSQNLQKKIIIQQSIRRHMKQIWLEKYRPKTLKQVYGNLDQLSTLKSCVSQGSIPHMILSGPPGVGKTSSVLCIVRQLLGDKTQQAVKELNASDERGIDAVRQQIKKFAQKKVNLPPGHTKVIILDEADSLTQGAQHALRMIISNYSDTTRFILSCNDSQKIIEPIQSRCIMLRFSKLKDNQVEMNLKRVIEGENIKLTQQAFKTLLFIADGDMRQAINNLQACYFASQGQLIDQNTVLHICDAPSADLIKQILKLAESKQTNQALLRMHEIYEQGHSVYDIVSTIHRVLMTMEHEVRKEVLFEMLKHVAELKKRILEGLSSEIQLGQFLTKCAMIEIDS